MRSKSEFSVTKIELIKSTRTVAGKPARWISGQSGVEMPSSQARREELEDRSAVRRARREGLGNLVGKKFSHIYQPSMKLFWCA